MSMDIGRANFMNQAQSLLGVVAKDVGQLAGTAAGFKVGELLGKILSSGFAAGGQTQGLPPNQRFPSPLNHPGLGGQLKDLGIMFQTLGEVLNALGKLIGQRGMGNFPQLPGGTPSTGGTSGTPSTGGTTGTPSTGTTGGTTGGPSIPGTGGAEIPQGSYATGDKVKEDYMNSLDPQMKKQVEYQEKVQKMTEAFTLIGNILKMLSDAAKANYGNLK